MKKILAVVLTSILLMLPNGADAQGFWKALDKASKAIDKGLSATDKALNKTEKALDAVTAAEAQVNVDWASIPVYHVQQVELTDANGVALLNDDGTKKVKVLLVDQNGNYRSSESVKAQVKAVNKSVARILAKVGVGAGLGAATGKTKGALAGAAAGAIASIGDIEQANAQKQSLKQQEALLAIYEKNFDAEGTPIDASVDLSAIEGLDLKPENVVSMSSTDVIKTLESEDFSNTDASAWDF